MSVAVRCPNDECRRLIRVAASLRGKEIRCPACGTGLRIPAARSSPEPKPLDDTPTDLKAIPEPAPKKKADSRHGRPGEVAEDVANRAASAASALGPIVKLLVVAVVLVGLVLFSTKVLFPMLWAKKPIATATGDDFEKKMGVGGDAQPAQTAGAPLGAEDRERLDGLLASGDVSEAGKHLDRLAGAGVDAADLASFRVSYREALDRKLDEILGEAAASADRSDWDAVESRLTEARALDAGVDRRERYQAVAGRVTAGRIAALLDASRQAAARKEFDEAKELAEQAQQLDRQRREANEWLVELARTMKAGVRFIVKDGVVADVYLEGRKIGDTSRTVWELQGRTRPRLRLQAPGRVPWETRVILASEGARDVEAELVEAAPDALWAAALFGDDAERWLACLADRSGHPAVAEYAAVLRRRAGDEQPNARKRAVWAVSLKDGRSFDAQNYSVLGSTVRFVDLRSGSAVNTTAEQVDRAEELGLDDSARRWLAAAAERAEGLNPCDAFRAFARFVEVFPDKTDLLLEASGAKLAELLRELGRIGSCARPDARETRDAMELGARLDAEISAWRKAGAAPPPILLEQKRTRH